GAKEHARPPLADDAIARLGRDLGDDRRAFAAVDLDSALGMVALLVAPQTGRRTIAGNQALGVEHGQAPRTGTRAELPDRLISLADRRPQGRGCVGVTKNHVACRSPAPRDAGRSRCVVPCPAGDRSRRRSSWYRSWS